MESQTYVFLGSVSLKSTKKKKKKQNFSLKTDIYLIRIKVKILTFKKS